MSSLRLDDDLERLRRLIAYHQDAIGLARAPLKTEVPFGDPVEASFARRA